MFDSSLWAALLGPIPTLFSPTVFRSAHGGQEGGGWVQDEVRSYRRRPPDAAQRLPRLQTKWVAVQAFCLLLVKWVLTKLRISEQLIHCYFKKLDYESLEELLWHSWPWHRWVFFCFLTPETPANLYWTGFSSNKTLFCWSCQDFTITGEYYDYSFCLSKWWLNFNHLDGLILKTYILLCSQCLCFVHIKIYLKACDRVFAPDTKRRENLENLFVRPGHLLSWITWEKKGQNTEFPFLRVA